MLRKAAVTKSTTNCAATAAITGVSASVTPTEVEQMPLIGRDAANLAYLAPGVKSADSYDPTKNRYAILAINGSKNPTGIVGSTLIATFCATLCAVFMVKFLERVRLFRWDRQSGISIPITAQPSPQSNENASSELPMALWAPWVLAATIIGSRNG